MADYYNCQSVIHIAIDLLDKNDVVAYSMDPGSTKK